MNRGALKAALITGASLTLLQGSLWYLVKEHLLVTWEEGKRSQLSAAVAGSEPFIELAADVAEIRTLLRRCPDRLDERFEERLEERFEEHGREHHDQGASLTSQRRVERLLADLDAKVEKLLKK